MGNEQPLVSIVTPLYNAERFIEEMIDSVIGQTYSNWELIIIDDASTDRSFELVKAKVRNELRIRLYQFQENKGAAAARNKGIQQAKGKYLAFLDSDDLWLPTKLEKQVDFMEQGEKVFSFTSYYVLKENMNSHKKLVSAPAEVTYELLLKKYDYRLFNGHVKYREAWKSSNANDSDATGLCTLAPNFKAGP